MKRRHYFIKKRYQSKFIICFLIVALLGTVIATYLFDYLAQNKIEQILYSMRLPSGHTGELLLKEMLFSTMVALIIVVTGVLFVVFLQTQKAKGPIGRIAQEAENMAKGDLITPVRLRQGDEFKEILPPINEFKSFLRKRFLNANQIANLIETLFREKNFIANKDQIDEILKKIQTELNELKGDPGTKK